MKTIFKTLSLVLVAGSLTMTSCKKNDDVTPEEETNNGGTNGGTATSSPAMPQLSDADGVLIASKAVVSQVIPGVGTYTFVMGSATGSLYSATGGSTMVDGGTVKANDSTLSKQSNNAYIFTPKSTGINYGSNSRWNISGNSGNSVPAVTYTANGFPSTPSITGTVTSISKGSNFTLSTTSVSNADSICFQITSSNTSIYKIKAGSQTSHTFTSSELSALDNTSTAFITITGYKFNNTTVSSKKYYFINLTTSNKSVSITN